MISAENKRNGRVEVIETVIRRMELGMERWGVPVPPRQGEEETELALVIDDADFQPDADAPNGAPARATASQSDDGPEAQSEERQQA